MLLCTQLNLVIQDGLKEIDGSIERITERHKYIRASRLETKGLLNVLTKFP